MRKQLLMALASLLLLAAANLQVVCRVSVDGQPVEGLYSPAAVENSQALARRTAEEILLSSEQVPKCRVRRSLSFRPAEGDGAVLTDALLRATPGIAVRQEVRVNGLNLGHVADGDALDTALRQYLYGSRPVGAVGARYTEEISVNGVYTRLGRDTEIDDMLLLVTGCCPVMYTDANGAVIRG